jgi:hypothetical protein
MPLRTLVFVLLSTLSAPVLAESSGDGPAVSDFFNALGAGGGNPWAQQQLRSAAVAKGMKLLLAILDQNGGDPEKAMTTFVQSPEGQKIMRVPGAFAELLEAFHTVLALPTRQQSKTPNQ